MMRSLSSIIQELNKASLIHRDLRPHNLLVNNSYDLILIDFEFLIDEQRAIFTELKENHTSPKKLLGLWGKYARGFLWWDDAYSGLLVFDEFCINPTDEQIGIRNTIKRLISVKQAFHTQSNTLSFTAWLIKITSAVLKAACKARAYKTIHIFTNSNSMHKKTLKYSSLLNKHMNSLLYSRRNY